MNKIEDILKELRNYMENNLNKKIQEKKIRYEISGQIEVFAIDVIIEFFKKEEFWKYKDHELHKNKNKFPDLVIEIELDDHKVKLFFELKAADSSKDPANDLGTLRNFWKKHILTDVGIDNLYNLFMIIVKYSTEKKTITKIDKVYISHYFKFIGSRKINSIEILKYRKKDGNLRPKSWKEIDNITDLSLTKKELEEFFTRYYLTVVFRSNDIIKEHKKIVEEPLDSINLKEKFLPDKLGIDPEKVVSKIKSNLEKLLNQKL
jgi:hypothetical protein